MGVELVHRFVPGNRPVALLALHGAGGDENDFVQICRVVAPGAAILSPRLAADTSPAELAEWLAGHRQAPLYAFAYGEGADLAAAILLHHPGVISGGVLLRPHAAARPAALPDLKGAPILIASEGGAEELARLLSEAAASVDFALAETGRDLGPQDFGMAKRWFAQILT
jgi:phospholipase/carboxylesterase